MYGLLWMTVKIIEVKMLQHSYYGQHHDYHTYT